MKRVSISFGAFLLLGLMGGCLKPAEAPSPETLLQQQLAAVNQTQLLADIDAIDDYLFDNEVTGVLYEENGVRYVIHTLGTGDMPKLGNKIEFDYAGTLMSNSNIFDEATGIVYPLKDLIIGWKLVLPLVPEGTHLTLYIPSGFAYGPNDIKDVDGNTIISANSNIIFDVNFISIK